MSRYTGLGFFDWVVVAAAVACVVLVVRSRRHDAGRQVLGFALVPAAVGTACLVAVVVLFGDTFGRVVSSAGWVLMWIVLGVVVLMAIAVVDLLFTLSGRAGSRILAQATLFGTLGMVGVVGLLMLEDRAGSARAAITPTTATTTPTTVATLPLGLRLVATHEVPGGPVGITVDSARDVGYISLGQGQIVRFRLGDVARRSLEFEQVADGLENPRGIAIAGDLLVVAEIGPLPCENPFPGCYGTDAGSTRIEGEAAILEQSRGRVTVHSIGADGGLSTPRVIIDDLPVINSDHGVNGVAVDMDGSILVTIGNIVDQGFSFELLAASTHPNKDWLGTVLRVDPGSGEVEVFATGLRNVFGLAVGPDGSVWGVDNDGTTYGGWREEELLQISQGDDFGFPLDGTYNLPVRRTRGPVWVLGHKGTAGIAWGGSAGLGTRLLIGSCGNLDAVKVTNTEEGWRVVTDSHHQQITATAGCVTGIAAVAPDLVLVVELRGETSVLQVFQVGGG
jgi:hypothetical protein